MPIRTWWERVVTTSKQFRPARRRRSSARFSAETFESRRMLSAFFVNSLADSHDATPGDGIAADSDGFTTLRAALEEANAGIGPDTVTLPTGVIELSATSGPLAATDDVTILGNRGSVIDGTAFDEVFAVRGGVQLRLSDVDVISAGTLAASLRPALLTANLRQADLIVAFAATPSERFVGEAKSTNGLSSLFVSTKPEVVFVELSETPVAKLLPLGDSVVPTPDQAIDQIINALFRSESDFVLPVSAEQKPESFDGRDARPMPKAPMKLDVDPPADSDPTDDEEVGAILRGWADEAGWGEFDFLTRGSQTITARTRQVHRVTALAGAVFSGVFAKSWSRLERDSWREPFSLTAWQTRFERLRRRAR